MATGAPASRNSAARALSSHPKRRVAQPRQHDSRARTERVARALAMTPTLPIGEATRDLYLYRGWSTARYPPILPVTWLHESPEGIANPRPRLAVRSISGHVST